MPGRSTSSAVPRTRRGGLASDHAVKAAAHALGAASRHPAAENRAGAALTELIRLAQDTGDIPSDVTVADLYLLFTTAPTDRSLEDRVRWLQLALRAITVRHR